MAIKLINQLKEYFDPPQSGRVEYKYYARTGQCNSCGKCCSGIHLIHGDEVIDSIEKFEKLKVHHADYQHFIPNGETEAGIQFRCSHLQEDNTCGIYDARPAFCKKYPSEATLLFGGDLAPGCGFTFEAKLKFEDVMQKASKRKRLKVGRLLEDV